MPFLLLLKMKGGSIGMANYEKQVEQEAAYKPHPYIFLQTHFGCAE